MNHNTITVLVKSSKTIGREMLSTIGMTKDRVGSGYCSTCHCPKNQNLPPSSNLVGLVQVKDFFHRVGTHTQSGFFNRFLKEKI